MAELASLVLFANNLAATTVFYRALGLDLVDEDHDDGPRHVAAEVGGVHVAIYPAEQGEGGVAVGWRRAASTFPGFYVESLDATRTALRANGAVLLADHEVRSWGCRFVARDPDGRAIEVNQRGHCAS